MDKYTTLLRNALGMAEDVSASPVRSTRVSVVLGRWLATAFSICFITGLYSHLLQDPPPWMLFPTRPAWLYQFTQGLHIASGIASIPLLLGKLWSVFPKLFAWPPITSVVNAIERASIALLVAASLVEVTIGLLNTYQWYPWHFPFRQTHYWLAWIIVGSIMVHIAVKWPLIAAHWRRYRAATPAGGEPATDSPATAPAADSAQLRGRWSRRGFLAGVAGASAAVVLTTAGQSFAWLAPLNVFAPRKQNTGPQAVPVNRSAAAAQIAQAAQDPQWALHVKSKGVARTFSLADLAQLPQSEHSLPVACVEGWSQDARWGGVSLPDLLAAVGSPADRDLRITSLEKDGFYRQSTMPAAYTSDTQTLVALRLNGEVLDLDHGYPARIMAPGRPGVLQTKWLATIEVL